MSPNLVAFMPVQAESRAETPSMVIWGNGAARTPRLCEPTWQNGPFRRVKRRGRLMHTDDEGLAHNREFPRCVEAR